VRSTVEKMKLVSFSENPQGTLYLAICIAFQVLACFAIVLRFWSRAIQKITPQVSDWAIIAALVSIAISPVHFILPIRDVLFKTSNRVPIANFTFMSLLSS